MSLPLTDARLEANRANAQHSTGPTSPEGKAAVSQNRFRHGLTGIFTVLPWEDREQFDELVAQLREEHQPASPTEHLLVDRMVQHHWLAQRAITCQHVTFSQQNPHCAAPVNLALYLRYQTTNERAFSKCLADLQKATSAKEKEASGFESQERAMREEIRREVLFQLKCQTAEARLAVALNRKNHPIAPVTASRAA